MTGVAALVATPRPFPDEAQLPFLVRATEANGYQRPTDFLAPSGVSAAQFQTASVPIAVIAKLLACDARILTHIDHIRGPDALRAKTRWLAGHEFPLPLVQLAKGRICPECVQAEGYVSAFFSLTHAIACPIHGLPLVESCGSCGKDLRWRRPGLLTCECGTAIGRSTRARKVPEGVRSALELVYRLMRGESLRTARLTAAGYPLKHLETVRPCALLTLAKRLAKLAERGRPPSDQRPEAVCLAVLDRVLRDWPLGFHAFLASEVTRDYFPLGKRQKSTFHRLFTGPEPDRFDFLEDEFFRFGLEVWDWGRPVPAASTAPFVTLEAIARTAGVRPEVARRLITRGTIEAEPVSGRVPDRYRCDLRAVARRRPKLGTWYSPAQAAEVLKLPADVLAAWLKNQPELALATSFHERDLYCLHQKVLALVSELPDVPASAGIPLGQALAKSKYTLEQKEALLAAVLAKTLAPLGRCGRAPRSIVIAEADLDALVRSRPKPPKRPDPGEVGVLDAASLLRVDPDTVSGLLKAGHLQLRARRPPVQGGRRIDAASILCFAEQYVAASVVASVVGEHPRGGTEHFGVSRHRLLRVVKPSSGQSRTFLPRTEIRSIPLAHDYLSQLEALRSKLHAGGADD